MKFDDITDQHIRLARAVSPYVHKHFFISEEHFENAKSRLEESEIVDLDQLLNDVNDFINSDILSIKESSEILRLDIARNLDDLLKNHNRVVFDPNQLVPTLARQFITHLGEVDNSNAPIKKKPVNLWDTQRYFSIDMKNANVQVLYHLGVLPTPDWKEYVTGIGLSPFYAKLKRERQCLLGGIDQLAPSSVQKVQRAIMVSLFNYMNRKIPHVLKYCISLTADELLFELHGDNESEDKAIATIWKAANDFSTQFFQGEMTFTPKTFQYIELGKLGGMKVEENSASPYKIPPHFLLQALCEYTQGDPTPLDRDAYIKMDGKEHCVHFRDPLF